MKQYQKPNIELTDTFIDDILTTSSEIDYNGDDLGNFEEL